MKRSASANLGEKLAPTGGYWEVKERVWILTVNDGVQIKGLTRYADKFLAYIASQVPDMVGSFKDAKQAYLFDVPDRDLDLTVWTVQSVKTLARQMGVRVIDKSGYRKSTNPYAYMYTNIEIYIYVYTRRHMHKIRIYIIHESLQILTNLLRILTNPCKIIRFLMNPCEIVRILTSHSEFLRNHEFPTIFTNPYTQGNHHFDTLSMLSLGTP